MVKQTLKITKRNKTLIKINKKENQGPKQMKKIIKNKQRMNKKRKNQIIQICEKNHVL